MQAARDETVLRVERIGARGDGIAWHDGEPVYLPLTAPGDVVRARLMDRRGEGVTGRVIAFETEAARAAPRCPHFGACGGCALQHLTPGDYAAAKTEWLSAALKQHGLDSGAIRPLRLLPAGTRRRARFAVARGRTLAFVGFHARASHRIVDMEACAVLHPSLAALVPPLRALATTLLAPAGEAFATATLAESGIDLLLDVPASPGLAQLEAMAAFACENDLARLAWRSGKTEPTPVAQRRPVRVTFGGIPVDLPFDAFLQASVEADLMLAQAVAAAAIGAAEIADLYAGVGTFTFALAALGPVHAVEGDAAAISALEKAALRAHLRVSAERRDLERRPLLPAELNQFDTVVFDPPRAGAKAQSAALAGSAVRRVVAVSCNPATFARDARTLTDGGFRLAAIAPFDSFVWSAHLELVARFER